ncbi:MAG: hypothetical protein K1X92_08915 [Bacteroidia bacterium]|nr:hypothetical protein [Bacteroidia bacterium]
MALTQKYIQKLQARFEREANAIRLATEYTLDENDAEKEKRIAKLLKSPKLFQEYYLPFLKETPEYLVKAANKVLKTQNYFGWWMMFRGARKSTWTTTILPMMLLAKGELDFMLTIGPNENFSARLLGNLQVQLENNERYIRDFGPQKLHGSWAEGEFTTRNGSSFVGLGMGQPVRGLNIQLKRPDYIVISDVDSKELSKNPARCREMYHWMMEDVMGTQEAGGERFRFIFDNNYFSKTSLGHILLTENPEIDITRVDVMDKDGNPAAAFITPEWIEERRKKYGYRGFMREYMNTPIEEGNIFKADWIVWKPMPEKDWKKYEYILCYVDPSFKANTTSDYKAIVTIGKIGREYHILKGYCRQTTIPNMVRWHYDWGMYLKRKGLIVYHVVEGGFIQGAFLNDYNTEGRQRGEYLDILIDDSRKDNKHARIEASSTKWERGEVLYNEAEKDNPDMQTGISQTLAFERGSKVHDDFPDACDGGITWLEKGGGFQTPGAKAFSVGEKERIQF